MIKNDLLGVSITLSWVLIFLVISEYLAHKEKIEKPTARKIIHISVGHVILFLPFFETILLAAGIPFIFTFGNYMLSPNSPVEKMRLITFDAGHAWGTILYPLSLSIVTYLFFAQPFLVLATFFPVVYGDGFAAITGPKAKSGKFTLWSGDKTIIGTATVFIASFISIVIGGYVLSIYTSFVFTYWLFVLIIAAIATITELISLKGTDNLFIPLILALVVYIYP